jgi:hypothetical protein
MGYNQNEVETNSLIDRSLGKTYANVLEVLKAMPTIRKTLDLLGTLSNPTMASKLTDDTLLSVPNGSGFLSTKLSALGAYLVGTFPSLVRGTVPRTLAATLADYTVSVKFFGAKGDGLTDDSAALQAAFAYAVDKKVGLYFPNGTYLVKKTIQIGTDPNGALTGLTVTGQSRLGTIIKQAKNNTPIFSFVGKYIHTIQWRTMSFTYAAMQTGQKSAAVFTADGGDSFYMSTFEDITAGNFYFFFDAPTMLFWGNCYRNMWMGDYAGGVNRITGGAGEPNCRFEHIYVTCASGVEPVFNHQAMAAQYDNIEVNEAFSGATMIYDVAGGTHVIGHFALEGAHYDKNATLFDVQNSVLLGDFIYTESISSAAGVDVYVFHAEGERSFVDVKFFSVKGIGNSIKGAMLGTLNASLAIGPLPIRFKECRMPFAANVRLTNVPATGAADFTVVENWNDRDRSVVLDDADLVLSHDSAYNQIFGKAQVAPRVVMLPQGTANDTTQLFSGRGFRIVKSVAAGQVTVKDSNGNVVATLLNGSRQSVEVIWSRGGGNGFSWFLVDQRGF